MLIFSRKFNFKFLFSFLKWFSRKYFLSKILVSWREKPEIRKMENFLKNFDGKWRSLMYVRRKASIR